MCVGFKGLPQALISLVFIDLHKHPIQQQQGV